MKLLRWLLLTVSILVIGWLLCTVSATFTGEILNQVFIARLRECTAPLEPDTVRDLCTVLALSTSDRRCQPNAKVYAQDFNISIPAVFEPGEATYDIVDAKLGHYLVACERPVYATFVGYSYRCHYDLKGDGTFPISITFHGTVEGEGLVENVSMGDSTPCR